MSRPNEALPQLWDECRERHRIWNTMDLGEEQENWFLEQDREMAATMLRTSAAAPAGIAVKLKAALLDLDVQMLFTKHLVLDGPEPGGSGASRPLNLIWSAIRDLERMAADAELVRLGEELLAAWRAERDAVRATGDDDDITDLCRPVEALIERILKVQARTFAGIGVKAVAYAMIVDQPEESDTFDGRLYRGIHHDACALWEPQP